MLVELTRRQRHRWPGTNSNFPWRARCQRPQLSAPSMIFSRGRRSSAGPFLAILFAERVFSPLGMTSGPAFVSPLDSGCRFSVRVKKIDVGVQVARATTAHEFRRQPTIPFARWSRIVEAEDRFPQKVHSLLATARSSRPTLVLSPPAFSIRFGRRVLGAASLAWRIERSVK